MIKPLFFLSILIPTFGFCQIDINAHRFYGMSGVNTHQELRVLALHTQNPIYIDSLKSVYHLPLIHFRNSNLNPYDTATHPIGRTLIIEKSGKCTSINLFGDTNILPQYVSQQWTNLTFEKNKGIFQLKLSSVNYQNLFDGSKDSIAIFDLYKSGQLFRKNWYAAGKLSGLFSFRNFNNLIDSGINHITVPYRNPDFKDFVNYQPGDWIEYVTRDGNNGPPDYMQIELLEKNSNNQKVKVTFLDVTSQFPISPYLIEKLTVDTYNLELDSWVIGLRDFNKIRENYHLKPPSCYGLTKNDSSYWTTVLTYDTINNRFTYRPNILLARPFEDWWTGWSITECIGPATEFGRDRNSQELELWNINSYELKCAGNYGQRRLNTKAILKQKSISIYPNPVHSILTVQMPIYYANTLLNISDANGRIVKVVELHNSFTEIDVTTLHPGFYYIGTIDSIINLKFIKTE
ncbi:MAG: T9SS type A sorting domain-containing protein [Bacteroidia bacterium]|nr:T9SS type A sorting domain-containing protein [Bacteroidia bacterium]